MISFQEKPILRKAPMKIETMTIRASLIRGTSKTRRSIKTNKTIKIRINKIAKIKVLTLKGIQITNIMMIENNMMIDRITKPIGRIKNNKRYVKTLMNIKDKINPTNILKIPNKIRE